MGFEPTYLPIKQTKTTSPNKNNAAEKLSFLLKSKLSNLKPTIQILFTR